MLFLLDVFKYYEVINAANLNASRFANGAKQHVRTYYAWLELRMGNTLVLSKNRRDNNRKMQNR